MGFKRDGIYLLGNSAVQLVAGTVSSIVVARWLGAEGKGILYLLFLLPTFVVGLGGLGFRASAVYFVGKGNDLRRIAIYLAGFSVLLGALYAGAGWALRDILGSTILKGLGPGLIGIALLLIPVTLVRNYTDGFLHGRRRFGLYATLHGGTALAKAILLLVFLPALGLGMTWAVVAYLATLLVQTAVTAAVVTRDARPGGQPTPLGAFIRYGLAGHIGNLAQRANLRLDVFLLNPVVGPAGIGVYSIAVLLGELIWHVPNAAGEVLLPRVAGSSRDSARAMTEFLSRNTVLLATAATVVLLLAAPFVIRIAFGEEFADAVPALFWLAPGLITLSVSKILTKYLAGIGRPILNSSASILALAVNAPLLLVLIPRYGINGAAAATSLAYILQTAFVVFSFARETGRPVRYCLFPRRADASVYRALWKSWKHRVPGARQRSLP
jgi:O-antigen/teichoic acid export membrane protein